MKSQTCPEVYVKSVFKPWSSLGLAQERSKVLTTAQATPINEDGTLYHRIWSGQDTMNNNQRDKKWKGLAWGTRKNMVQFTTALRNSSWGDL